ncbi:RES domain-containing protein [Pseudactinotalea sp.]|uniref:RES domain-containing protein n=1 Tax=Pseudactinotalea sp. TaxID=1926260 RepID=UPI003B3B1421
MLVYRVVPVAPGAQPGTPGHPEYTHKPQSRGRLDNPSHYDVRYVSATESGAVGETLAIHPEWTKRIFAFKAVPGATMSLCTFLVDDGLRLLDMDDAHNLLALGLRPTQVVTLDRAVTQSWALRAWEQHDHTGRKWQGIKWWSRHSVEWPVMGLWNASMELESVVPLDLSHRAVRDAARTLTRTVTP